MNIGEPVCGIYILRNSKGQPVYVGQSTNVLARIGDHANDINKVFCGITVLECEREELDDLEGLLIKVLAPPLNGNPGVSPDIIKSIQHWGAVPADVERLGRLECVRTAKDKARSRVSEDEVLSTALKDIMAKADIANNPVRSDRYLLNSHTVRSMIGGREPSKYMIEAHKLPKPIKSGGRKFWLLSEIRDWIDAQVKEREKNETVCPDGSH